MKIDHMDSMGYALIFSTLFGVTLHVAVLLTASIDERSFCVSKEVPAGALALVFQASVHFNGVAIIVRGTHLLACGHVPCPL